MRISGRISTPRVHATRPTWWASRGPPSAATHTSHDSCGGNKTMSDVVDHNAEPFNRSHAEQRHIARLCEDHLVDGFKTLGTENSITGFASDKLLGGRG